MRLWKTVRHAVVGAAPVCIAAGPDGTTRRYNTQDGLPDEKPFMICRRPSRYLWWRHDSADSRLATTAGLERPIITRAYNHKKCPHERLGL